MSSVAVLLLLLASMLALVDAAPNREKRDAVSDAMETFSGILNGIQSLLGGIPGLKDFLAMQGLGNILNALGGLTGPTTLSLGSILGELGSAPGGVGGVWPTVAPDVSTTVRTA